MPARIQFKRKGGKIINHALVKQEHYR